MVTKEEKLRRFDCPVEGFEDVYVELPEHWLGKHVILRDQAIEASKDLGSMELTNLVVNLNLVEGFGNIPGIKGTEPEKWRPEETPLAIMAWLIETVTNDYLAAYNIPKNSLSPLTDLPAAKKGK